MANEVLNQIQENSKQPEVSWLGKIGNAAKSVGGAIANGVKEVGSVAGDALVSLFKLPFEVIRAPVAGLHAYTEAMSSVPDIIKYRQGRMQMFAETEAYNKQVNEYNKQVNAYKLANMAQLEAGGMIDDNIRKEILNSASFEQLAQVQFNQKLIGQAYKDMSEGKDEFSSPAMAETMRKIKSLGAEIEVGDDGIIYLSKDGDTIAATPEKLNEILRGAQQQAQEAIKNIQEYHGSALEGIIGGTTQKRVMKNYHDYAGASGEENLAAGKKYYQQLARSYPSEMRKLNMLEDSQRFLQMVSNQGSNLSQGALTLGTQLQAFAEEHFGVKASQDSEGRFIIDDPLGTLGERDKRYTLEQFVQKLGEDEDIVKLNQMIADDSLKMRKQREMAILAQSNKLLGNGKNNDGFDSDSTDGRISVAHSAFMDKVTGGLSSGWSDKEKESWGSHYQIHNQFVEDHGITSTEDAEKLIQSASEGNAEAIATIEALAQNEDQHDRAIKKEIGKEAPFKTEWRDLRDKINNTIDKTNKYIKNTSYNMYVLSQYKDLPAQLNSATNDLREACKKLPEGETKQQLKKLLRSSPNFKNYENILSALRVLRNSAQPSANASEATYRRSYEEEELSKFVKSKEFRALCDRLELMESIDKEKLKK